MGRSLYRERGLKYIMPSVLILLTSSLPLPGAWIEMHMSLQKILPSRRSLYRERGLK